jgi:hypothetical protein
MTSVTGMNGTSGLLELQNTLSKRSGMNELFPRGAWGLIVARLMQVL